MVVCFFDLSDLIEDEIVVIGQECIVVDYYVDFVGFGGDCFGCVGEFDFE